MQDFFLTRGLDKNQMADIKKLMPPPRVFEKGELIYSEEHFLKAIGVITKGSVTVKTADNGTTILRTLCARETFGASAVYSSQERFVSKITAATQCEIVFLDEDTLSKIFLKFPSTVKNYIELLSDKIRFLNQKIGILSAKSTPQRVYEYLLTVCNEEGNAVLPNMTCVCKTLGIGRSSLYRSFDILSEKGLIEKRENKVKVISYEKNS